MAIGNTQERHPLAFRTLHEVILTSILILILTGFYIHRPFVDGAGFLMALVRGAHFLFAAVLVIGAVLRVIFMFIGRNRDWRSFIPSSYDLKQLPRTINYYAYISKKPDLKKKYNPLQMVSYCLIFLLVIFQIISGFSLQYPDGWLSWLSYGIFANEVQVRIVHYVVSWVFILFMMIHVYLTIRENFKEIADMHLPVRLEEEELKQQYEISHD